MKKIQLLGSTTLQSVAVASVFMFASPAFAQDAAAPAQDATAAAEATQAAPAASVDPCIANPSDESCKAIVVTGSRIKSPNLTSPVPVTSISGEKFFETGNVSVGDALNDLPALRSTFSQANSTRFLGTAGLNLLDLRGLGTVRTLVLQNGRRHVGGDVLSSGVTPDVNTIPTDLIERVEVVTGGNSAVYGSDAIAGVVNFVLKDDYEGLQIRGQGGISRYEDAGAFFISALGGKNFADGRGNVAVNFEYARQNQYFGSARPFIAQNDAFIVTQEDALGTTSDGTFDRTFFHNIRSTSLTNTGMVRFGGYNAATGLNSVLNCGFDYKGRGYNCPFMFTQDGKLVPITGDQRVGAGPNGSFIGGNGENFRGGDQFQMSPQLDRYNINLVGHIELSNAFVPFVEAKFSRTSTVGTGSSGPAFITGTTLADPFQFVGGRNREAFRLDNPYLDPQARQLIIDQRALNGQSSSNATTISLRENMTGLGARTEKATRNTFRIVTGVRGDLGDDWNYEISANYGQLKEKTEIEGNLDVQRFLLAKDAVVDPTSGKIVCRSQINPSAAFGYYPWFYNYAYGSSHPGADPNADARLAKDVAACTPINPFGGNFTQAQRDYLLLNTTAVGKTSQIDLNAYINGNTGKFLNLPGGPINFVLGAEYREDDVFYRQDPQVQMGYTFYNAIPTFKAPKSKVSEAYGEIRIPVLKDMPFFHELEVSGAARVSDYSIGNTGAVWAWNGNVVWAPVRDLRFRANLAKSVRAPNQVELFSPLGQNYAPGFADPCSARNINTGSANRAANCAAAGIPTTYDFVYSQSLELQSGGNVDLKAETGRSLTLGAIFQPRFIPGFSLSVDYYNIKVRQVISGPSAQSIVNSCYDLAAGNQFCSQFQRSPSTGGPHGEDPYQIIEGSLFQIPLNYAKLQAKGIDVEASYSRDLGSIGKFDTNIKYTHVLDRSNYLDPTNPGYRNVIVGELGDPKDSFNWSSSLRHGPFTFGYEMRFISGMYLNTYEDFNSVQGRDPENPDYAAIHKYPARFYHDARVAVDVSKAYNFYLGVDNLTNTKPPLGLSGIGAGSAIYDARGRFYYAGFQAKF